MQHRTVDRAAYVSAIKKLEEGLADEATLKRELVEGARLKIAQEKFARLSRKDQKAVRRGTMKIMVPVVPEPDGKMLEMAREMVRREVARLRAELAKAEALEGPADYSPTLPDTQKPQ